MAVKSRPATAVDRRPQGKMKVIDLSQPFSMHTPGWVNYPSPKISYFQRHHTQGVVSQWIETSLHVSTHIDGEMHGVPGGKDIASMPLDRLVHEGVVVDLRAECDDFTWITPEMITSKVEVKKDDIVIINTGWHKYYTHNSEENDVKYFCYHPGGSRELRSGSSTWNCHGSGRTQDRSTTS
jgi:kynurenine formamidase